MLIQHDHQVLALLHDAIEALEPPHRSIILHKLTFHGSLLPMDRGRKRTHLHAPKPQSALYNAALSRLRVELRKRGINSFADLPLSLPQ